MLQLNNRLTSASPPLPRPMSGNCVRLFQEPRDWRQAQAVCRAWGGDLVQVTSMDSEYFANLLAQHHETWIGMLYNVEQDVWGWSQGGILGWYQPWATGSPSRRGDANCGALWYPTEVSIQPRWKSEPCAMKLPFLCDKPGPRRIQDGWCACCERLRGTTSRPSVQGFAVFTDLFVSSQAGAEARIHFTAYPSSADPSSAAIEAVSSTFSVAAGAARLQVLVEPGVGTSGQPLLTQPVVLVIDSAGFPLSSSQPVMVEAALVGSAGSLRGGTRANVTYGGAARFTDLVVDIPSGVSSLGLALRFTARVAQGTDISTQSSSFLALQRTARLSIMAALPSTVTTGAPLPTLAVSLLDDTGSPVLNANVDIVASVRPALPGGPSPLNGAITGHTSVRSVRGEARFTNLAITQAGTWVLRFTAPFVGFYADAAAVAVTSGAYTGLAVKTQPPPSSIAGAATSVTVMLVDKYGNLNAAGAVTVVLTVAASDGSLLPALSLTAVTAGGLASFTGITLTRAKAGMYARATLVHDQAACLASPPGGDSSVCGLRATASARTADFAVVAAGPMRLELQQAVSPSSPAGTPFASQPRVQV